MKGSTVAWRDRMHPAARDVKLDRIQADIGVRIGNGLRSEPAPESFVFVTV